MAVTLDDVELEVERDSVAEELKLSNVEFPVLSQGRTVGNSADDYSAYRGSVPVESAIALGALMGQDVSFDDGVADPSERFIGNMGGRAPVNWTTLPAGTIVDLHFGLWNVPPFCSSGPATFVQSADGSPATTGATLASAVTVGNLLVGIPFADTAGLPATIDLYDPRDPGSCPAVSSPWTIHANFYGATTGGAAGSIATKIADETYPGPYKATSACGADSGRTSVTLLEFSGVCEVAAVLQTPDDQQGSTIDCGTFSGYGADDVIVMAVTFKKDGGGDPGVSFAAEGFTQLIDTTSPFSNGLRWVGYKIGGTANAKVTHSGDSSYNWGAAAIHLTS